MLSLAILYPPHYCAAFVCFTALPPLRAALFPSTLSSLIPFRLRCPSHQPDPTAVQIGATRQSRELAREAAMAALNVRVPEYLACVSTTCCIPLASACLC